jgi:hypothetical protein
MTIDSVVCPNHKTDIIHSVSTKYYSLYLITLFPNLTSAEQIFD